MEDAKDSVADKDSLSQLTSTNKNETVKDDSLLFSKPIEVGTDATWNVTRDVEREKLREPRHCQQHAKKVMKHALRQQAKRRRKNTTIAAGNSAPSQRLTLSPSACDIEDVSCDTACYRQPTMAEVLASIPGWSVKPRKSSRGKKLSAAAQLDQAKEGTVDLESPDSILVNSNLRSLLNKHTFSSLPPLYQYKLLQLLPHVDRTGSDSVFRLSGSGLNNEFFARACLDWRERLAEGEFTPENQAKIKAEQEKEKSKLDPWKLKHFEPTWGESLREWPTMPVGAAVAVAVAPTTTPTLAPTPAATAPRTKAAPAPPSAALGPPTSQRKEPIVTRLRTVGAVTRAVANYREKRAALSPPPALEPKRNRQELPKHEQITNHIEQDVDIKMEVEIVSIEKRDEDVSDIMDGIEEAKEPDVSSDLKLSVNKSELNGPMTESEMNSPTADSEENASIFDPLVKDSDPTADSEVTISVAESEVNTTVDESEVNAPVADSEEDGSPEEDVNTSIFDPVVNDSVDDSEVMEAVDEPQRTESVVDSEMIESEVSESIVDESEVSESIVDLEMKLSIDGSEENEPAVTEEIVLYSEIQESIDESELRESVAQSEFAESGVESDLKESVVDPQLKEFITLENEVSKTEEICENSIDIDSDFDKQEESQESVSLTTFRDDVQCEAENELSSGFTSAVEEGESIVEEKQTFVEMPFRSEEKDMKFEIVDSMVEEALILEEANESPPILPPPTPFLGDDEQQSMDGMQMGGGDPLVLAEEVVGPTYGEKGMLGDRLELVRSEDGLRNEIRLRSGVVGDGGGEKWEVIQVDPREKGGGGLYEGLKEDEAAILAAAWDVVSTPSHFQDLQQPVSVIPCQEELEVRLQESSLPAPQWIDYSAPARTGTKQGPGHVKLELEVTLTPEVDSQVTSSSSSSSSSSAAEAPVRVIPPTTIVCLPPLAAPPPPPPPPASTSALPYLALTTSTPVRALPTKPLQTKCGVGGGSGRGGRGSNTNKPPPGAVNLERSYQICQAVIQNSPNRHQLRCQLKPPPSLLVPAPPPPRPRPRPTRTVLLRHVFTSTAGIPVSMAVLPSHHPHVRRSNSAPPSHPGPGAALHCAGAGGGGRPASVACVIGTGSCSCSLRPLVPCRRCGDFCHEDCITPSRLCVTCHSA